MSTDGLAGLIVALVALGGFFLSMRSTSYAELKALFDALKKDFSEYKENAKKEFSEYKAEAEARDKRNQTHIDLLQKSNEEKDKQIDALEDMNRALANQNDSFKRYIIRLILQLEDANVVPEKMDES